MVKKSDASENVQKLERNGNTRSNGHSIGGDTLAMGLCSASLSSRVLPRTCRVIVRLNEKLESVSQFSGFLFQFIHDDVPRRHHYMVDLDIW